MCINPKAMLTDDANYSCHIKAVELVENLFENMYLPVEYSFTQVSLKDFKEFLHIFGSLKMQDALKLNWVLKSFPKKNFRGFWICCSTKNC